MIFLTSEQLSLYDMGAMGFMFIIAAGLLRLVTFIIKQKYEADKKAPCRAFEGGYCRLKCYFDDLKIKKSIEETHETYGILLGFKNMLKIHLDHSQGNSERISKKSMDMYRKVCAMFDHLCKTEKIDISNLTEEDKK